MNFQITKDIIKDIVDEVSQEEEKLRRILSRKRHDLYKDQGKIFLIEELTREFKKDSMKELRLCPINVFKEIVNKKAGVYKRKPIRKALKEEDQELINYYSKKLSVDRLFQKSNKYWEAAANTSIYCYPAQEKEGVEIKAKVIPNYLFSIIPDKSNLNEINAVILSEFVEGDSMVPYDDIRGATNSGGYDRQRLEKADKGLIASNERTQENQERIFVGWSDLSHMTFTSKNNIIEDPEKDGSQFINPIEMIPFVNIFKDRDIDEVWAKQGEDSVDLSLLLMKVWTDILTIAKHQGYGIMLITGVEEPKKMEVGITKGVYLKSEDGQPAPSLDFKTSGAPISEQVDMAMDILGLLLQTNNLNPGDVGGRVQGNVNSAMQAMIQKADPMSVIEESQVTFKKAEETFWELVRRWHNWLYDEDLLSEQEKSLGKFTEDEIEFGVTILYPSIKPIISRSEILNEIEREMRLGLINKKDAVKRLEPELDDEEIEKKLNEIKEEKKANMKEFQIKSQGLEESEEKEDDES